MARTPQQIGAANRRNGKGWQMDCADWLRRHGFPSASYEIRNKVGDVIGVGDINIECTIAEWDKIWIKEDQSAADAKARGFTDWVVWKKRRGKADPGMGGVLMRADKFFALLADLYAYQRAEADFQLNYEKTYQEGFHEGTKDTLAKVARGMEAHSTKGDTRDTA